MSVDMCVGTYICAPTAQIVLCRRVHEYGEMWVRCEVKLWVNVPQACVTTCSWTCICATTCISTCVETHAETCNTRPMKSSAWRAESWGTRSPPALPLCRTHPYAHECVRACAEACVHVCVRAYVRACTSVQAMCYASICPYPLAQHSMPRVLYAQHSMPRILYAQHSMPRILYAQHYMPRILYAQHTLTHEAFPIPTAVQFHMTRPTYLCICWKRVSTHKSTGL